MLIQAYTKEWIADFETIKEILLSALAELDISIEHIGSTSVHRLAAKPIIDIDIIYRSSDQLIEITSRLADVGYYHNGNQGIPGREVFKRMAAANDHKVLDAIQHHLYACPMSSDELQRHLLFRDYLRTHTSARAAYQQLKYQIAEIAHQDRKVYAQLKEKMAKEFIHSIIQKAKEDL